MRRTLSAVAVSMTAVLSISTPASATGPGGWDHLGTGGTPSVASLNGQVSAFNTDIPGVLLVGGSFTNAGGIPAADRIARWDGTTWSALGATAALGTGSVLAIEYANGKIFAGGNFTDAGGSPSADHLAVFDGTSWAPFCNSTGPAFNLQVNALQVIGDTLYVGGTFQNGAGIPSADYLLACDLGSGAPSSTVSNDGDFTGAVYALTADSNEVLYAGGTFGNLDGIAAADLVASYDGNWSALGSGGVTGIVRALAAKGTDVYVSTDMVNIGSIAQADHVAKWNGTSWSAMGSDAAGTNGWFPASAFIYEMTTVGSIVLATGSFQNANGDPKADVIAVFDGSAWRPIGSNGATDGPWVGEGQALATMGGRIFAGGNFTSAGGDTLAKFAASRWLELPDARIGTAASGPFIGDNVFSATAVGESKTISVPRGTSKNLYIDIQNEGPLASTFVVTGTGAASGFSVKYFHGTTNVTALVKGTGYSTGVLSPGASLTLRMVIKPSATSANRGTFRVKAVAGPGAAPDAVKAVVNAT